jgi:type II secretory ATPase GspE/PulE/Tfp pilus assembly ATPase PilB-like protein
VKVLCPHCKVPFSKAMPRYSDTEIRRVMSVVDIEQVFVVGEGCEHCRNTGTVGRTVVAETVTTDATMMVHIRNRDRIKALEYWKRDQQGKTMLAHAIEKVRAGLIDPFAAEDIVGLLSMDIIGADHRVHPSEVLHAIA